MSNIKFGVRLPNLTRIGVKSNSSFYNYPDYEHLDFGLCKDVAEECEKLGYHAVYMNDHLVLGKAIFECWTLLSAISSITSKIRLGSLVLNNVLRAPSLVGKMSSTLDVISNGRLEFGIGAGGMNEREMRAYGMPLLQPSERIQRLEEAITVIKKLWIEEKASYKGKYYQLQDAICEPKPIQKPHPPITIGANRARMLKLVARNADVWDSRAPLAEYKKRVATLRNYCSTIGRDFSDIEKSWGAQLLITSTQDEVDEIFSRWKSKYGITLEEFSQRNIVGTPEQCIKIIQAYLDVGVTSFIFRFNDLPSKQGLRLFAEHVMNKL